jgi:peptidyl-prolyl cis-trans isomerase A (cyclophilin A)/peptidyl-prolyl cis-trans isomerase B (cyclophilin B)
MNVMKRYAALAVSALLVLSLLSGCGSSTEEKNTQAEATTVQETAAEQTESTEESVEASTTEAETQYDKVEIQTPSKVDQMSDPEEGETVAVIHVKDYGDISVKFFYEDSPLAVENFVTLAANGYYDGLTFHRVIENFMIQTGDPTGTGTGGTSMWGEDFANEYSDRLAQVNGALAMARTQALDTNASQFFINNGRVPTEEELEAYGISDDMKELYTEYGGNPWLQDQYTIFGQVYDGMDVVEAISTVSTDTDQRPVEDVVISSIDIMEYSK